MVPAEPSITEIAVKRSQESAISQDVLEDPDIAILVTRLKAIFNDVGLYRKLLRSRDSDAQKLLDTFQRLLDTPRLDTEFRRGLIIATQRIARNSNLYPTCYELKDVVQDGQDPVSSGGFADIYKGVFQGRVVCMKTIRLYQVSKIEDFLKAVSKETILWGQLSHPNVLPIYGLYRIRSKICLVSPWMKEGKLSEYLEHKPDTNRLQLAVDVANGLSYLHKNAIVHGDLKSPNILINDQGRACLADFGLSSISDSKVLKWTSHSSAASRGGSVRWQAPELFDVENDEPVNNSMASDVYAWSFVCYEIFTGNIPFPNILRDATVMNRVQSGARPARPTTPSPAWRDWGLTEKIWSVMEECWTQDPHERLDINQVLEKIVPDLAHDERSSAGGSILTPSEFRRASNSYDMITVSALDSLLGGAEGLTTLSPDRSHAFELTASYNQMIHRELTSLVDMNPGCNPTQNAERDLMDHPPKRKRSHDSADDVDLRRPAVPWTNEASSDPNTKHSVTLPSPPIPEPSSSLHSDLFPVQSIAEPRTLSNVHAQTTLPHPSQHSTETTDQVVQYYTQNVVSVQYPFADDSVRATICQAVLPHSRLREAAGLLASVHRQRSAKPGLMAFHSEEMQARIRDLQSTIRGFGSNSGDAMAALHVISSYLFDGRSGPWEQWLDIPYRYVDYLFVKYGGPSEVLVRCSAEDAVIIKMTIWFDVLASVTTQRSPHFLLAIRTMFNLRQTNVFNTYSDGKSSMMSLLGCHDEVIWALAEISHLSDWKQLRMAENCLSVPSLVKRAMPIDEVLAPPTPKIYASRDIHGCRVLASEIFRSSARLYLETVLSGDYPLVPEIKECVQDTINCIERLSSPPSDAQVSGQRMSQSIVQNTMFAFFICGALAEQEVHRDVIKSLLDLEGDRVGNSGSTHDLFDKLWGLREGTWRAPDSTASPRRPDAVNWRKMLSEANVLLA